MANFFERLFSPTASLRPEDYDRLNKDMLKADQLALIQEERRRKGEELAALFPEYFNAENIPTDVLDYGLVDRLNAIKAGAEAQLDENPVRRGVAQALASTGMPTGAVSEAAGVVDLTPIGSVASGFDVVSSGQDAVKAVGEGRFGDAAKAASSGILSLADVAATGAPLVPAVRAGGRAAGQALDAKFQRDYENFVARHPGLVAPEEELLQTGVGQTFYSGGINDIFMDVGEDVFDLADHYFAEARSLRDSGASAKDILKETGVRFFETRDAAGNLIETRPGLVNSVDESVFSIDKDLLGRRESVPLDSLVDADIKNLRGKAFEGVDVNFDSTLGKNQYGYFRGRGKSGRPEIVLNPKLSDADIHETLVHEVEHLLQKQGGLPEEARGTSREWLYDYVKDRIPELKARIKAKSTPQDVRDASEKELAALQSTDLFEMYERNPGEATARATEEGSSVVMYSTPLSTMETINPKLIKNPKDRMRALVKDIATKFNPSEKGVMALERNVLDKIPGYQGSVVEDVVRQLPREGARPRKGIPMRMEDTRVYDLPVEAAVEPSPWDVVGFADGGVVPRFMGLGSMGREVL